MREERMMTRYLCLAATLIVFSLTGCSSPPPKTAPKTAPPPPTVAQPDVKVESSTIKPADPAPPVKKEEPKKEEPKKEEPKDEPKNTDASKPASIKMVPLGKETGFEEQDASGKSIRRWISALESDNKEQVIEALAVYQMVGKKGAIALPKVEFLTNSPDTEIATEARAALEALKSKD
jgi:outer membrane biosynthesis protein TonB